MNKHTTWHPSNRGEASDKPASYETHSAKESLDLRHQGGIGSAKKVMAVKWMTRKLQDVGVFNDFINSVAWYSDAYCLSTAE